MAVNSAILKKMVQECCCSLSYDDEEQQFSFSLKPRQDRIWLRLRKRLQALSPQFFIDDFNNVLSNIKEAINRNQKVAKTIIYDTELMNGEVLELSINDKEVLVFVKMETGQYLDTTSGRGISVGSQYCFEKGKNIVDSEGKCWGLCQDIFLRVPMKEHIALSWHFMNNYYRNNISSSLWQICDAARKDYVNNQSVVCNKLLSLAKDCGVNTFTLLNILRGVVACQH